MMDNRLPSRGGSRNIKTHFDSNGGIFSPHLDKLDTIQSSQLATALGSDKLIQEDYDRHSDHSFNN